MSTDLDRVLAKIRKLLALAERAGEGEQAAALAQVDRLLQAHDLTREQINQEEREEEFETQLLDRTGNGIYLSPFQWGAKEILLRYFQVKLMGCPADRSVEIFGRPHHVAVATYVWVFLIRAFRDKWNRVKGGRSWNPTTGRMERLTPKAYVAGLVLRVSETIAAGRRQTSPQPGLVPVDPLDAALDQAYPGLTTVQSRLRDDAAAISLGYSHGADITIHTPLRDRSGSADRSISEPKRLTADR